MVVYLGFVALVTLTPSTGDGHSPMWYVMRVLQHIDARTPVTEPQLELVANVVLFVPLGLLGVGLLGRGRWGWVVVAGLVLTCSIELAQHQIPGRVPDLRDVAANTAGACAGACVALLVVGRQRDPSDH